MSQVHSVTHVPVHSQMAQAAKVFQLVELSSLQALVAFDFFLQLQMKRFDGVNDSLDELECGPFA
jgi:hypothetical protein